MLKYQDVILSSGSTKLKKHFFGFQIQHIPRKENFLADQLAQMASTRSPIPPGVFFEQLDSPSVVELFEDIYVSLQVVQTDPENMDAPQVVDGWHCHDQGRDWITSIYNYIQHDTIPEDNVETDRIARKAKSYTLNESTLYKRGSHGVLMRCISQTDVIKLLTDIHEGVCGAHHSYRTLVGKAFRKGYYWPTALHDAKELVTKCVQC